MSSGLKPSKKAVKNERGFIFDTDSGYASDFNKNKKYNLNGLKLCLIYSADKKPKEYLLFKNGSPIYSHTSMESIAYKADLTIIFNQPEDTKMSRVVEYKAVAGNTIEELNTAANAAINEGFIPNGGLSACMCHISMEEEDVCTLYTQTFIKNGD